MFLTKKHLSRRTVLKGAGVAIALPLLDAMIPASTAWANTAAAIKPRLGFVYFPHGAVQKFWVPKGTGKDFEFSRILKPLESVRDYVTVVTNIRNKAGERQNPPHGIIEQAWLTCQDPQTDPWGPGGGHFHRPDRREADRAGHAARLARVVRRARRRHLLPRPEPEPSAGRQPAQGVLRHVRPGRFQRRSRRAPQGHRQPARLRDGGHPEPEPSAGRGGSCAGQQLPGFGARGRGPRPQAHGQGRLAGQPAGCAAGHAG